MIEKNDWKGLHFYSVIMARVVKGYVAVVCWIKSNSITGQ
jgi:sulfur transfer protein SufE